ncbi:hypothetical protein SAMN05192558_10457 [Actinokineospora alba]|uniref:Uncharacterized protein n=1 Tax=Actinokineospora alba TaxID=504798 RepID=A0A1H0L9K6_9PSEU|nr:hypothetical protein [Actinokineospora alba]TDP67240.1 hypothetical protein C8E96_2776 [Actinokineospora alba]SDJ03028.1 hypothetical protein SAMN05421871_109240 [Actinokineospora alba]SDO64736.1 hypothetical protein SAMN05192558_10457 [Actinokineospora alba]
MNVLTNAVLTTGPGTASRTSPISVDGHTMAPDRLLRYLQIKVHHLIQDHDWDSVHVVGGYDRQAVISAHEKNGKLFNSERPTAQVNGRDLVIKAFPGADYVHHYALIIATYLFMTGKAADTVTYDLPDPAVSREAVKQLDLDLDGDLVIVGWGLAHLAPPDGTWTYGHGYAWQRTQVHGRRVVYLGFLHSIWGDVAGRVVTRLAELGARDVVYVGKVGALNPDIEPNTRLATGNTSLVGGRLVTWPDFFGDFATAQPGVHTGIHVTSPSILLENRDWLTEHAGHAFVDPEIGPMGAAAHRAGIGFGYLHVISNNLARHYPADLSNERHRDVVQRRTVLIGQIRDIIADRLAARPI